MVLGFDGADAQVVERLLAEDKLPNLAALRDHGAHAALWPTNPAQSPVSWATIATGLNPGGHQVYDFLARDLTAGKSPGITIGLARVEAREVLGDGVRALVVLGSGAAGGAFGVIVALGLLARISPAWKRGGRLQAAATLPAAILALGALTVLGWLPEEVPVAVNVRQGTPFWQALDKAGIRCVALEAPVSFPADTMEHGACLAGLGVPDLRKTWGSYAIWTDDPMLPMDTETGGNSYFVDPAAKGGAAAASSVNFTMVLQGPDDPGADPDEKSAAFEQAGKKAAHRKLALDWDRRRRRLDETEEALLRMTGKMTVEVPVEVTRGKGAVLHLPGGMDVALEEGNWSGLVPLTFRANPIVQVAARARFLLVSAGESIEGRAYRPFKLFVSPMEFDAAAVPPHVPLSSPHAFAGQLAAAVGPYHTLGWPEMTNPAKDDLISDPHFLAHIHEVLKTREAKLYDRLGRDDWDCLFAMFSEQDRVQHIMWRHTDPEAPTHDPEVAPLFAGEIDKIYVEMDRIVGEVMERVKDDGTQTEILVVSDHGFSPFRRGVNLTNFLRAHGFQAVKGESAGPRNVGEIFSGEPFYSDVDWSRTYAYTMGLGNVYLNLVGREQGGIVPPDRAQEVLEAIRERLLALRDTDGAQVVRGVYLGSEIFHGAQTASAPDLVVGFERGYRVSWQTSLGGVDADIITDNTLRWSGDHCSVDPSLVKGIWFSSLPFSAPDTDPRVEDVAPSVLHWFGLPADGADGRSLWR